MLHSQWPRRWDRQIRQIDPGRRGSGWTLLFRTGGPPSRSGRRASWSTSAARACCFGRKVCRWASLSDGDVQLVIYLSRAQLRMSGVNLPMPDMHCDARVARVVADADGRLAIAVEIQREWLRNSPGPVWVSTSGDTRGN